MKRCALCANCVCVSERRKRARERAAKRGTISVKATTHALLKREAKARGTSVYALVEAAVEGVG